MTQIHAIVRLHTHTHTLAANTNWHFVYSERARFVVSLFSFVIGPFLSIDFDTFNWVSEYSKTRKHNATQKNDDAKRITWNETITSVWARMQRMNSKWLMCICDKRPLEYSIDVELLILLAVRFVRFSFSGIFCSLNVTTFWIYVPHIFSCICIAFAYGGAIQKSNVWITDSLEKSIEKISSKSTGQQNLSGHHCWICSPFFPARRKSINSFVRFY